MTTLPALVMFDLETTSVDAANARIVEIALVRGAHRFSSLVCPDVPIPADATAVHGISDADVQDAPHFAEIAVIVQDYINAATLVGYNSRSFDTLILDRELREASQPGIDLDVVLEVDLYRVWQAVEPRTLEGALNRYGVKMSPQDAHRAPRDALALSPLGGAMQDTHDLSVEQMIALSRPADEVDRSGKLRRLEDGTVAFAFGKYEGEPVLEHLDYCDWMLGRDFPADTKAKLRELMPPLSRHPDDRGPYG